MKFRIKFRVSKYYLKINIILIIKLNNNLVHEIKIKLEIIKKMKMISIQNLIKINSKIKNKLIKILCKIIIKQMIMKSIYL